MPPSRDRLTDETLARKQLRLPPFRQLAGADAIPRCGESLLCVLALVRAIEERGRIDHVFRLGDLRVDGFGEEEVDAVAEVLHEGNCIDEPRGSGDEGEGADVVGDLEGLGFVCGELLVVLFGPHRGEGRQAGEPHQFLRNHAAHAYSYNVHRAVGSPADVVEHFDHVLCHFARRISHQRLIGLSHAAVVEDQAAVRFGLRVTKVLRLPLPVCHEGSKAHEPLLTRRQSSIAR